ncbi:isoleucine--tRNA ligase [Buchnera aphidicola]|uniref:isoleucine--tRNA ligase n=1 Tax=Buchnera aphidicola TaxID=9 RepID=UPI003464C590
MKNYKFTLNLPITKFSMKGNLSQKEPEIIKKWKNNNLYKIIRIAKKGKKKFLLHDGPPYANGNIHLGHAVNKILKDIIIKSKNLSGFDAPYTPTWDCHGLPIEHKVENIIGKPGKDVSFKEFRSYCRKYAEKQVKKQKKDFIRLGILGDWDNSYLTMDFKNEANVILSLSKIIKKGYIYKDFRPVHWCLDCSSSLAEAEVEYYEKISDSIIFMLKTKNIDFIKEIFNLTKIKLKQSNILIWTTTPWSLPACRAITLHPNFEYQLIKIENNTIIIAKHLVEATLKKIGILKWKIIGTTIGKKLENLEFSHPFLNFNIPIILATHVTKDMGTGAIHTAPDYGQEDYEVSKKYGIKLTNIIDSKGYFKRDIHPALNNLNIFESNNIIIDILEKNKILLHKSNITHSYPYCWRHKTPIISKATPQWFLDIDHMNLREKTKKEVQYINWIPTWGKERMESMISNRPDWCISRQRTWGIPITLFVHKETRCLHPKTIFLIEKIAQRVSLEGIQIWWDLELKDLIKTNDANQYEKILDVLDVWFESGSIQISKIYQDINLINDQANLYLEGSDQYRGWFMSSLIVSMAISEQTPYHEIITHGFTVDENKRKMSKSIGNTISPISIIENLGADILRLWVASTDYSKDMFISYEILKQSSDYYRRIRNTIRFFLANLNQFDPKKDSINFENMIYLDRWAISKTLETQKKIKYLYDKYKFHEVIKLLIHFCSIEMSAFYLDIIKDRLYTTKYKSYPRKSCQTAMYLILQALVRWISPILSFTADEIWTYLPDQYNKCLFAEEWFIDLFSLEDNQLLNNEDWNTLIIIRNEVNHVLEQARLNKKIGTSLEASIILYVDTDTKKKLKLLGTELKFFFITSDCQVKDYISAPSSAIKSKIIKNIKIDCNKHKGKKCLRCWHYVNHLEYNHLYSNICSRCIKNTSNSGEKREFI